MGAPGSPLRASESSGRNGEGAEVGRNAIKREKREKGHKRNIGRLDGFVDGKEGWIDVDGKGK